jgi:nicotinic acid mononucleotide adenylyltransferase
MNDNEYAPLVERINSTPYMGYYTITGGGTRFASTFLECGGGSATILGINIPYNQSVLDDFLADRNQPEKYVSEDSAIKIAKQSFEEAQHATLATNVDVFGIGVTVSLAKNVPERPERQHHIYLAGIKKDRTVITSIVLNQSRTRGHEEKIVEREIFKLTARLLEVEFDLPDYFGLDFRKQGETQTVIDVPIHMHDDNWSYDHSHDNEVVDAYFAGSFNPIHDGHRYIKQFVKEKLGLNVVYELSIKNVEKNVIDIEDLEKRLKEIGEWTTVTNCATFNEKIKTLSNFTPHDYIIGYDTFERIVSLQYNTIDDMKNWSEKGVKFIVIPRYQKTWKDAFENLDNETKEIAEKLIVEDYQKEVDNIHLPHSSTEIRTNENEK